MLKWLDQPDKKTSALQYKGIDLVIGLLKSGQYILKSDTLNIDNRILRSSKLPFAKAEAINNAVAVLEDSILKLKQVGLNELENN